MIVPGVRQHPGFVAGTWTLDRESSESFVTFDSRDAAESMQAYIVANAGNRRFVANELVGVRVLEVSATTAS